MMRDQSDMAADTRAGLPLSHSLWAVDRKEITVKGVKEVLSFDESLVDLVTSCGRLTLEGHELRVTVLDTAGGVVAVTGKLCGVLYDDPDADGVGDSENGRRRGKRGRLSGLFH